MIFPAWYVTTLHVNYKLLGIASNVINDYYDAACFADFRNIYKKTLTEDVYSIVVYPGIINTPYTLAEVKKWVSDLNELGFPCRFLRQRNDFYYIKVPIKDNKKTYYTNKDHLLSTLTLLRCLSENNYNIVPFHYFKILEAVGTKVDKFAALQVANQYCDGGNHSLIKDTTSGHTVKTKKEVFENFKASDIYCKKCFNIHNTWSGNPLFITITKKNYKEFYTMVTEQRESVTKVFVVGGANHYANWLPNITLVPTMEESDVVLFTGGEDVSPSLYGEPTGVNTCCNLDRDMYEQEIFNKAKELKKKFLGICRGSQFLCVMAGGKLVQDQSNPAAVHKIETIDYQQLNISSTHHQAAYPFNLSRYAYQIIAWTKNLPYHYDGDGKELHPLLECEIVHYKNIDALGIQGHPEFETFQRDGSNAASLTYLKNLFNKFIQNKL